MDEKNRPTTAAPQPPKPQGLSEERKTQIAQHWGATPIERRAALVAHIREYGTPEEKEFIEKISNSRN